MKKIYHIAPKRSGHVFIGNVISSWLPEYAYVDLENKLVTSINPEINDIVIFQTRDFLNWFASYFKSNKRINYVMIRTWSKLTSYYLEKEKCKCNTVYIVYDSFFTSRVYRQLICNQIGGKYTEKEMDRVRDSGKGSSFDGTKFDGRAFEMDTLNRWKSISPKMYREIFKNMPEVKLQALSLANEEQYNFIKSL